MTKLLRKNETEEKKVKEIAGEIEKAAEAEAQLWTFNMLQQT